jgi:hypothetical protein
MQIHRTDDSECPHRRANPSPPVGHSVYGLGSSHALRVDFEPVQLPWLADEVDTLSRGIEDELARARARRDQTAAGGLERSRSAAEAEKEVARREYQLQVLRMIRDQVPVRAPVAAACVSSPWDDLGEHGLELAGLTAPATVVGPAQGMLVLIRGAARNVADALGEALRISERDLGEHPLGTPATRWPERHRLTAAVADRLRELAAAAVAFTDNYVDAVRQQAYSFDPEYYPTDPDELW